ncbi:MAG: putative Extracellular solute-binding protein family 5 [Candidatus Saccharibacteria bacterium]|nr:putative Extracellular solute-binding protein family 5 [Candidatus Saccharibacteria bacterium]
MADRQPGGWRRLPKMSFNSKDLSRRMKRMEGITTRHAHRFVVKRWSSVRDVRRHITIWVLVVGLLIAASGLQLLWYKHGYQTVAAAESGTYAEAVIGPIDTLNPLFASTAAEESARTLLFSQLLRYDRSGHLNDDVASSVTINETQNVYTVNLRKDVSWHDGRPLTARDVVYTVSLLQNPAVRTNITGWNGIKIEQIDEYTVMFTLPGAYAAFRHALTFPIVPEHLLGKVDPTAIRENAFSRSPVGSGAFVFRSTQDVDQVAQRQIIYLARNADYYLGAPKIERFQLHVYGTHNDVVKALNTSEVNAASGLYATEAASVHTDRYAITTKPIQSGVYALLNTQSPLLANQAIRKALQVGTNTSAIRNALGDSVKRLDLPFLEGQLTGDVPSAPAFDQAAAKKMLDDAGWVMSGGIRKKDAQELRLDIVTVKNSDFEKVLGQLTKQWSELGIGTTTHIVDPTDVTQNFVKDVLQGRSFDVLLYQLDIGGDPDVYAYWHSSQASSRGLNFSNYSNAISDDTLASARSRIEPELRNAKYLTFARQWLGDVPAIGLYQSALFYASGNNIHNIESGTRLVNATDRYANVQYWSVNQKPVYTTP